MSTQPSKQPIVLLVSPEEAQMASKLLSQLSKSGLNRIDEVTDSTRSDRKEYDLRSIATLIYATRRDRTRIFPEDLFADPAWDMLIALYCAHETNHELTTSSVIHSAEVPYTTGVRWVKLLEKADLIKAGRNKSDRRVIMLELTDKGRSRVEQCLMRSAKRASELLA